VLTDEIYRDLYYDRRPASISEFCDKTIIVSGLSKMMSMTGWRIGWAIGPEEVIERLDRVEKQTLMQPVAARSRGTVVL